jgi:hypothetical protein
MMFTLTSNVTQKFNNAESVTLNIHSSKYAYEKHMLEIKIGKKQTAYFY